MTTMTTMTTETAIRLVDTSRHQQTDSDLDSIRNSCAVFYAPSPSHIHIAMRSKNKFLVQCQCSTRQHNHSKHVFSGDEAKNQHGQLEKLHRHVFLTMNCIWLGAVLSLAVYKVEVYIEVFLGPRGPLVEPSISVPSTRPVPSATILPEFILHR